MSERVIDRIYQSDEQALEKPSFPQIGFINCDGRQHLELLTESLFMGQYMGGSGGSNTEIWANYNVFDFHLPSEEELKQMSAIIIPGSVDSVNGDQSWVPLLLRFVKNVYTHHKQIKILGIAFGCQVVAKALGGTVEPVNPQSTGTIGAGIFIGKKIVTANEEFFAQNYVQEIIDPLLAAAKNRE